MKNVMISETLFFELIRYFNTDDNENLKTDISQQLLTKLEKIVQHELYTSMHTAPSQEEREIARNKYLDLRGIPQSFRF